MKNNFYTITCITNLHMGSGDINFNIIDNEVERDPLNGYPIMFSSGIKGALREHFETLGNQNVVSIFGSDINVSRKDNSEKSIPGNLRFLNAELLFLPVRAADGEHAFYYVTTKQLLVRFRELFKILQGKEPVSGFAKAVNELKENLIYRTDRNAVIEDIKCSDGQNIPAILTKCAEDVLGADAGRQLVILPDSAMKNNQIPLPVLARNQLVKGESKNLWYEELVPHGTVFFLPVLSNGTTAGDDALVNFDTQITGQRLVQFGADATIGYGLTEVKKYEGAADVK